MNTMAKGTIAGLAGIALLLGGAGTFALWNDTLTPWTGDTVQTGALQFDESGVNGTWYDVTDGSREKIDDLDAVRMVPGDTFQFEGTVTFLAYGKNLDAVFTIESLGESHLPDGLEFDVTDENGTSLELRDLDPTDEAEQVVKFFATLTFDSETDGLTSQMETVDLAGLTFKLEQVPASS